MSYIYFGVHKKRLSSPMASVSYPADSGRKYVSHFLKNAILD